MYLLYIYHLRISKIIGSRYKKTSKLLGFYLSLSEVNYKLSHSHYFYIRCHLRHLSPPRDKVRQHTRALALASAHTHLITSLSRCRQVSSDTDSIPEIANLRAGAPGGVGSRPPGLQASRSQGQFFRSAHDWCRVLAGFSLPRYHTHARIHTHAHTWLFKGVLSFSIAEEALA